MVQSCLAEFPVCNKICQLKTYPDNKKYLERFGNTRIYRFDSYKITFTDGFTFYVNDGKTYSVCQNWKNEIGSWEDGNLILGDKKYVENGYILRHPENLNLVIPAVKSCIII
jgi:hypothetical protein